MITYPVHELSGFCFNDDRISSETYGLICKIFNENNIEEFYSDGHGIWGIKKYNKWEMLIKISGIDVEDRDCIIGWYNKRVREDIKNGKIKRRDAVVVSV